MVTLRKIIPAKRADKNKILHRVSKTQNEKCEVPIGS